MHGRRWKKSGRERTKKIEKGRQCLSLLPIPPSQTEGSEELLWGTLAREEKGVPNRKNSGRRNGRKAKKGGEKENSVKSLPSQTEGAGMGDS